ncbi:MAG: hypothetical protein VR72_03960 [Clostridiaceae bacterium BRH_c20a]|nr:MAG: hypothetical protein VR72_03960 [Clostridiaceae bacterium BRH_c20a]
MNAEEAREIWEGEVSEKAQGYIEFIKKKILQYTYQENVFFYVFDLPNFVNNIKATDLDASDEFIQDIFQKIIAYFSELGFKVKADYEKQKIWLTYLKRQTLKKDAFTENILKFIKVRNYYRTFTGIDSVIDEIEGLIRESARRNRNLSYQLTLNIPNEKSLLLEDLVDIIDKLEKAGFSVAFEGDLCNKESMDNKEYVYNCIDEGLCFEELRVNLIIRW